MGARGVVVSHLQQYYIPYLVKLSNYKATLLFDFTPAEKSCAGFSGRAV